VAGLPATEGIGELAAAVAAAIVGSGETADVAV
jgi:hypothetical protein